MKAWRMEQPNLILDAEHGVSALTAGSSSVHADPGCSGHLKRELSLHSFWVASLTYQSLSSYIRGCRT